MDARLSNAIALCKSTGAAIGLWMIDRRYSETPGFLSKVQEFCVMADVPAEEWMAQSLSQADWIGCVECACWGKRALCFGRVGCHGFLSGCGCWRCLKAERKLAGLCGYKSTQPYDALGYRQRLFREAFAQHLASEHL